MKRTPLTRSTPIKRQRDTPRRKAPERVPGKRGKKSKTAAEKRYHEFVASLPCLVCGRHPVQVHHVTASIHGGRFSRSHWLVTPLCCEHHKIEFGPLNSVEALGHAGFFLAHGYDLEREGERIAAEWRAENVRTSLD